MVVERAVLPPHTQLAFAMCADEAKIIFFFLSCQYRGTQSSSPKDSEIESYKLLSFITAQAHALRV